jgi:hypothetical protein
MEGLFHLLCGMFQSTSVTINPSVLSTELAGVWSVYFFFPFTYSSPESCCRGLYSPCNSVVFQQLFIGWTVVPLLRNIMYITVTKHVEFAISRSSALHYPWEAARATSLLSV